MSHFSVAVILDGESSIEALLEPYAENTENPQYLEFNDVESEYTQQYETETMKAVQTPDGLWHIPTDSCFKKETTREFYQNAIENPEIRCWREYDGNGNEMFYYYCHENCIIEERPVSDVFSNFDAYMEYIGYKRDEKKNRYGWWGNPNAKWDWYLVGGRWKGSLKARCGKHGQASLVQPIETQNGYYDIARIGDVDFSPDEEERQKALRFWEVVVEGQPLKEDEDADDFFSFYKKEYYLEYFGTKEQYVRECSEFSTFAVVTNDGKWHEKGQMGWFGMSSETGEESRNWHNSWFDAFIKDINPDWHIAIVDCHI